MKIVETKVKIDEELLEKSKEYNIDIDTFLDTEFRKYVGAIEDKKKVKEHKHGIKDTFRDIFNNTATVEIRANRREKIINIIETLCIESEGGYAMREHIIKEAKLQGIEKGQTEDALDRLYRYGEIYEPVKNGYKVTE